MNVYIDESGDLGFNFKLPYRKGGSSRYLTIAFLLIPKNLSSLPKRIVRDLYRRKRIPTTKEIKGAQLDEADRSFLAKRISKLLKKSSRIRIFAITVNKREVKEHIRHDPNKLYNYMISLILPDRIRRYQRVSLIHDKRSIKVKSGNSLVDYLQIKIWFELNSKTQIDYQPLESHIALNL